MRQVCCCQLPFYAFNLLSLAGDSAVCIVGNTQQTLGSSFRFPRQVTVSNSSMTNLGVFGKQVAGDGRLVDGHAGVFISIAQDVTVSHNVMHSLVWLTALTSVSRAPVWW